MKYSIEWNPAADCENRPVAAAIDRSIYETDKLMTSFERVSGRLWEIGNRKNEIARGIASYSKYVCASFLLRSNNKLPLSTAAIDISLS